jgi:PAS domain-containing protein
MLSQRLARVAERTHNGVIVADAQGRALQANGGFTRRSGDTLDELLG